MITYDVFMIDPPWPKKKGGLRTARPKQGRELDYKTLSIDNILKILNTKILSLANKEHCLFVWTIEQFLNTTDTMFESLGYKRHARFIWDKENGIAPAFTVRYSHEYLIWYYKPKLPLIAKDKRGKWSTVLRERSREHSRKPEIAYKMIEELYPNANKYDVFSREKRVGWDQFGDECDYFTEIIQKISV